MPSILSFLLLISATTASVLQPRSHPCKDAYSRLDIPAATDDSSFMVRGPGHPWVLSPQNNIGADVCLICWKKDEPFVRAEAASFAVAIFAGSQTQFSIASGQAGACAPVTAETVLNSYGQLDNTWFEFATNSHPIIDVTREINPNGNGIRITTGSGCLTNKRHCVFANGGLSNCSGPGSESASNGKSGGCTFPSGDVNTMSLAV